MCVSVSTYVLCLSVCFCECDVCLCVQVSEMGSLGETWIFSVPVSVRVHVVSVYIRAHHTCVYVSVSCVYMSVNTMPVCVCVMFLCISGCAMLCLGLFFVARLSVDCLFVTVFLSMSLWCPRGSLSVACVSVYSELYFIRGMCGSL